MRSIQQLTISSIILLSSVCVAAQTPAQVSGLDGKSITATGILLATDPRCDGVPKGVFRDNLMCPDDFYRWGLITLTTQYSLRGSTNELRGYAHQRVTVIGVVSKGKESYSNTLDVQSLTPSVLPEVELRKLIEQLRIYPWAEPINRSNPTSWDFHFTPPMLKILQAGPAAQQTLLKYLDDAEIKDQVILLLGGMGDREAIEPIIRAMADGDEARTRDRAKRINLAANLALTNLTTAGVIWHHGGGITRDACPNDPKSCWYDWWIKNRDSFDISTVDRNYSNYPNYGVYQNPGSYSADSFIQR